MTRKMAKIVTVDGINPIAGADAIETAIIGGWSVVTKKDEFKVGDLAVYCEVDSFLPEGNPAWQFLVDKSSRKFCDQNGHVLRSIKLRGQVSQGLLLSMDSMRDVLAKDVKGNFVVDDDVSEILGILKYEPPVPVELAGTQRGQFPSIIPKTNQERIQNLSKKMGKWAFSWEVTEKLEGSSCTFALIDDSMHVCSRNIDLMDTPDNSFWRTAKEMDMQNLLITNFAGRNIAFQGELIGFGIQGNIYGLTSQKFFLFDIYDADDARYFTPKERKEAAALMGIEHVPVIDSNFNLDMDEIDAMLVLINLADGPSKLKKNRLREGLVFKSNSESFEDQKSFKVISNKYLLKQPQFQDNKDYSINDANDISPQTCAPSL